MGPDASHAGSQHCCNPKWHQEDEGGKYNQVRREYPRQDREVSIPLSFIVAILLAQMRPDVGISAQHIMHRLPIDCAQRKRQAPLGRIGRVYGDDALETR